MKIEEVLPAFRAGKKIRREYWASNYFFGANGVIVFKQEELLADDWKIVEEKPKTKTVFQWRYRCHGNGNRWTLADTLWTEEEAKEQFTKHRYEKHSGAFEVPDDD